MRISPSRSTLLAIALVGIFAGGLFAMAGCVYSSAEGEVFTGPAARGWRVLNIGIYGSPLATSTGTILFSSIGAGPHIIAADDAIISIRGAPDSAAVIVTTN